MTEQLLQDTSKKSIQQKIEDTLNYKGYEGSAKIDASGVFCGKIKSITDLVSYEASTTEGLVTAFNAAVDDYIQTCEELETNH